ncbi:phospholipase D family protein [Rhodanobacter sp. FDAARGOS 1247]|uniref:phospholipase D family protein n=1 Tax=Rhodanobacter sp. FDAARGOS 1247 TaxID=2778082 RepID=UPI0019529B7F|nr:phospholipase D family protein [Rhodanobacter sp. FDAARGOS 1247]QRP64087.1 phospholipase D family protein [Rhodanobacter sp. FDAARGOS 1247]
MFVNSDDYKNRLKTLVAEEDSLDIAVAFWGNGAVDHIYTNKAKQRIRVICNLRSGGTNPTEIQRLLDLARQFPKRLEIRHHDQLHAKVVLGKNQALIGSANLSSNGLSLQDDEAGNWVEAGILTNDPGHLRSMRVWFDELWCSKKARTISDEDMEAAQSNWDSRRNSRPRKDATSIFAVKNHTQEELKDRHLYLLIYRKYLDESAEGALEKVRDEFDKKKTSAPLLWGYQDWAHFPKHGAAFIDLYWGNRGKVKCYGAATIPEYPTTTFRNRDGVNEKLDIAIRTKTFYGELFGSNQRKQFEATITDYLEDLWEDSSSLVNNDIQLVIPLSDVVRILKSR